MYCNTNRVNTEIRIRDRVFELFISEDVIIGQIEMVARSISRDMEGLNPIFVCVLNGAFMFAADLIRRIETPCEVAFIRLKSYQGTQSAGQVREIHGLAESIEGRNVIVVEDIIDTGFTMQHLVDTLKKQNPASVRIATMLFKPDALQTDIHPDYTAIEIPNDFIVGYGLDYEGQGRNLRNIYKIKLC